MNILTIDTSTKLEFIAVSAKSSESSLSLYTEASHSATIFESIDSQLNKNNISIKDISLIGVGIGPGSFTGIRIALSTARMLAQIKCVPLVGIVTHKLYAVSFEAERESNLLIAFDAKKGRVFGALYKKGGDMSNPAEIVSPGDYTIEYLLERVDKKIITCSVGDGAVRYRDIIEKEIKKYKHIEEFKLSGRRISDLVKKTYEKDPHKFNDFNKVLPLYSRKSDAEINRKNG